MKSVYSVEVHIFVFHFHKILLTGSNCSVATQAQISILYNSSFVVDPNSYTMFVALLNIKTSDDSLTMYFVEAKKSQNHSHQ